jgi:hypothetical protein
MENTKTISLEYYNQLREDSRFLHALRSFGVDKWEGYEEVIAYLFHDDFEEFKLTDLKE